MPDGYKMGLTLLAPMCSHWIPTGSHPMPATATQTDEALTAMQQGERDAARWIAGLGSAPQPKNPFPRPATADGWRQPSDYMKWGHGFDAVCYREWGDPDADMARAERRAGC